MSTRAAILAILLLAAVAAPGCRDRDPASDEEGAAESEPPPDPHASCKRFLEGTWARDDFEIRYDPESGAGFVNWRGNRTVMPGVMLECEEKRAQLSAEGKLIDVRFVGEDRIEVSSPDYGSTTLKRAAESAQ